MVRHHTCFTLGWARILKTSKLIIHSMHFNSNASFETSGINFYNRILIPTDFGDLKISTSTTQKPKVQRFRVRIQANPLLLKNFRLDKKYPYSVLICKQVYVTRPGTTRIIQAPFLNEAHPKTYCPKSFSLGLVFYLSLFMMMDLSDIITKEDSLAWASLAATALHGWFFSGEKPIVTRVLWADLLLFQKGKIVA